MIDTIEYKFHNLCTIKVFTVHSVICHESYVILSFKNYNIFKSSGNLHCFFFYFFWMARNRIINSKRLHLLRQIESINYWTVINRKRERERAREKYIFTRALTHTGNIIINSTSLISQFMWIACEQRIKKIYNLFASCCSLRWKNTKLSIKILLKYIEINLFCCCCSIKHQIAGVFHSFH